MMEDFSREDLEAFTAGASAISVGYDCSHVDDYLGPEDPEARLMFATKVVTWGIHATLSEHGLPNPSRGYEVLRDFDDENPDVAIVRIQASLDASA